MTIAIGYCFLSLVAVIATFLPLSSNQHWVFRVCDFGRIQLLIVQVILGAIGFLFYPEPYQIVTWTQVLLLMSAIYNLVVLAPYFPIQPRYHTNSASGSSEPISVLSANVFQENTSHQKLIDLIEKTSPDIFLTIESNTAWEKALSVFDETYPFHQKVPLENTYGMHFYSKLKFEEIKVNYFVAKDIPSIEALLQTSDGFIFRLFGIHPPPPSPTEEANSKERDGELISIGKQAKKSKEPVVVLGDFNNVAWSKSTVLFRKTSGLIDARIGRGFFSTFHANYKLLRFPIDLFFHSKQIRISEFKVLEHIDSDHFPFFSQFYIDSNKATTPSGAETLDSEEQEEAKEMIKEGKLEQSDSRD